MTCQNESVYDQLAVQASEESTKRQERLDRVRAEEKVFYGGLQRKVNGQYIGSTIVRVLVALLICISGISKAGQYTDLRIELSPRPGEWAGSRHVAQMHDSGVRCLNRRSVYWYVAIPDGAEYRIRVTPRDGRRYGVCVSVDGRSTLTGQKIAGDVRQSSSWPRGYVIQRGWPDTIQGWRESASSLRKFVATSADRSVANVVWGDPSQVGFIVVSVFLERGTDEPRVWGSLPSGTGSGDRVQSFSETVPFDRADWACEVYVLWYATPDVIRSALSGRGAYQPYYQPIYPPSRPQGFIGPLPRTVP